MITQHLEALSKKSIVLASKSPRRRELLNLFGLRKFEVQSSSFEETLDPKSFSSPGEYATETAFHKAIDVVDVLATTGAQGDIVIAADTIVDLKGEVLEKPSDEQHAFEMLSRISGNVHFVHTGVVLVLPSVRDTVKDEEGVVRRFWTTTQVEFDDLSPETIKAYIATGEPMDKAGAYGIQGFGGAFVKRIEGCYFNVMGLPLNMLSKNLQTLIDDGLLVV
ncbi:hypothetical protein BSKO_01841 [Bryopsis sp. KO-2023]|nr:hypothetical protein BSKO_01841 [Bryopsis sp. KO-2023]